MSPLIPIVLVDHTASIPQADLVATASALQRQVNEQFGLPAPHGWGCQVVIRAAGVPGGPPQVQPEEWVLGLFATADQPGALGYHDKTKVGLPVMKVFPTLCVQDGTTWTSCASHELLETLADPELCRAAQDHTGKFWAIEVCDGVEADSYTIDGIHVSNFALPTYFEPPKSKVKYDWLGLCKHPLETRPGGYNQWFDPSAGWQQVKHSELSKYRQTVQGRLVRRSSQSRQ